jgi:IS1 family transposase
MVSMNRLPLARRVQVISALVEGVSIRSTVRMTRVAKNTIVKLLAEVGRACATYQDQVMRNLTCQRLQCDEIWSFVGCKERTIPEHRQLDPYIGDVWTWVAIDADTKLVPCWLVGGRDAGFAEMFMRDLASRLASRVQLTTDGHRAYFTGVPAGFGTEVDYAMLVKLYGHGQGDETRYSPPECIGCNKTPISGAPDPDHVSTSFAERQNLTMRMMMRRFTRLTNAFSKKFVNHEYAVALHFMHYNFARLHQTLRSTPAMKAGITDHLWSIEEIVRLAE